MNEKFQVDGIIVIEQLLCEKVRGGLLLFTGEDLSRNDSMMVVWGTSTQVRS